MKLSVIVPVYNAEKYLIKCLDSIFNQNLSLSEYEVIVVNDGSTDKSLQILKDYESKYKNIVLINQENQGVSSARNKGLDIAKGNYITFIDSDDSIFENTFKLVLDRVEKDKLEILYLNIKSFDEEGNQMEYDYKNGEDSIINNGLVHKRRTFPPTIYEKKLIGNNRFLSGIVVGEDTVFNAMVQSKAERCSYCSIPYYKYTIRMDSASKKIKTAPAYRGFIIAIESLLKFKNQNFKNPNPLVVAYFDEIITVFLTRIIEFNILPELDKSRFKEVKILMKQNKISYLNSELVKKFNFFDCSFFLFSTYQKYLAYSQKIYLLAHNLKKLLKK